MVLPLDRMEKREKLVCWERPMATIGSLLEHVEIQVLYGDIIHSLEIQVCSLRKMSGLEIPVSNI